MKSPSEQRPGEASAKPPGRATKPKILMIHGAFCGPWSLEGLQRKFEAAGYPCKAPALRFHDEARPPAALGTTGLADYAADLADEISALGQPPILVGHSMGGLLAQQLAARVPVRALILLAPSPPWGVPPTTLFEIMSWGLDLNHASEVDADAVTAPLLLLTGSEDRINPPSTVARIAALYGERATAEVLDGMGHWLIGEPGWEKLVVRALEWLKERGL